MWNANEKLLLRSNVLYKKREGSLFITPQRVAWQQNGVPQLNPSINYDTIASLQQTPKESAKILFKITTNHPEPKVYTFQFISAKGLVEREGIKAQVTELWAKARGTTVSSIGTPAPLTPNTGIGSPGTPAAAPSPLGTPSVASTPQLQPSTPQQESQPPLNGLSSTASTPGSPALSSAAPTPSTGSPAPPGMSIMSSSRKQEFKDRKDLISNSRELQKLHMELVVSGKIVSEEEFWSSPYVKRYRQKLKLDAVSREGRLKGKSSRMVELKPGQQEGSDVKYTLTSQTIHNIFSEYPSVKRAYDANVPDKLSEQHFWKRFLASEFFHRSRTGGRSQLTPYDDIFDRCLQEEDDENAKAPDVSKRDLIKRTIDLESSIEDHIEGGNAPDFTMVAGRNAQVLPLIRRFNRHASRVLETPRSSKPKPKGYEVRGQTGGIEDEILLDDLKDDSPPDKIVLDIQDTSRYFESQSNAAKTDQMNIQEAKQLVSGFKRHFEGWQPELTKHVMNPKVADRVCMNLTDRVRKRSRYYEKSSNSDEKLPTPALLAIQSYHSATNEILRHFWSSNDPYRADKNARMVEGLKRQQKKYNEVLITVNSHRGDVDRGKEVKVLEDSLGVVMTDLDLLIETAIVRLISAPSHTAPILMNMDSPSFLSPNLTSGGSGNVSSETDMYSDPSTSTTPTTQRKSSKKSVSTFIQKLYNMLENNTNANLISWCPSGTSFFISNAKAFAAQVLPTHFKHSNFSSFVRLLNMYGFHKISKSPRGQRSNDKEIWEFSHTKFIRGRSDLLKDIKRKSMDSETLRRETGDIQAAFSMLQMSQSDLLQQFYTLQESFTALFNGLEESRRVQQQQQQQIKQLFERQGLAGSSNGDTKRNSSLNVDPSTGQPYPYNNQPLPQQPQNNRAQYHRRTISTPSFPSNQAIQRLQNDYQLPSQQQQQQQQPGASTDEPFRMLVTTPSSTHTAPLGTRMSSTQDITDNTTPAYWMNKMRSFSQPPESQGNLYSGNNNNSNNMDTIPSYPQQQQQNDPNQLFSPLSFQTAVNTPLPPSPMMLVSPDLDISPGSSDDSLGSFAYNLSPSSNTLDHPSFI
ncbi:hypothetical protein [Absidia glauca]|uniref:BSD domain-containing protein n=1 Tax=Absidia glauca TaxID=4829 RepID=A0A163K1R1_ABSGL|nr:hypothetical protein [Absidia glauca]